jgi:hypothetical protein
MREIAVASSLWLSLCACATAPAEPRGPDPFPARPVREPKAPRDRGTPPLAPSAATEVDGLARLLLDGPVVGCNRFDVVVGDRSGTRHLMLRVDADHLRLAAGEHALAIDGRFVALELSVFAVPTKPILCTDIPARPGERRQRWRATSGTVKLAWHDEPAKGESFAVDIELVDVELAEDDGRTQPFAAVLDDVRVGWVPG